VNLISVIAVGMEIADPLPFSLTTYMADKVSVWV